MGIPGLLTALEPFAEHDFLDGRRVVIDGPALAYHILHKCILSGNVEPSNKLLGRSVAAWLDELSKHGISIEAIYFDGYLPTSKRLVRFQRTERITAQLIKRRKTFHLPLPTSHSTCLSRDELFRIYGTPQPQQSNPLPPPFHVPSVIEALRHSSWASVTHVVPGEADDFCAKFAYDAIMPVCILTSDSDLLVHDFSLGTVALFRDIFLNSDEKLACSLYDSREISAQLEFPVMRLAFEKERSQHVTMNQLRRICLENDPDPELFHLFTARYKSYQSPNPIGGWDLSSLDPRLSELISQFAEKEESPLIFMPMMTEDPSRRSVWDSAAGLRAMAYTFAAHAFATPPKTMREYRKITNVYQHKGTLVKLSLSRARKHLGALASLAQRFERKAQATPTHPLWMRLGLAIAIDEDIAVSGSSPVLDMLRNPKISKKKDKYIWEEAHFVAHILASFYSLRLTSQIVLALPKAAFPESAGTLSQVSDFLESTVPKLEDVLSTELLLGVLRDKGSARRLLKDIGERLEMPGLEEEEEEDETRKDRQDAGDQSESVRLNALSQERPASTQRAAKNPFDLLAMDD